MKKNYKRAWPTNPDFTEYAIFGMSMHVRVTNCLRNADINSLDELLL